MKNSKILSNLLSIWGLVLFAVLTTQCSGDDGPDLKAPQLTASAANSITRTSAVLSGTIVSNGNNISECGFLYSTARADLQASDSNAKKARATSTSGTISVTIDGLESGTTYYFCLYAKSGASQVLSSILSFETSKQDIPELNVIQVLEKTEYTIKVKSSIKSDGGAQIKQFGFDYKKINETKWTSQYTDTFDAGSTSEFTMTLSGLEAETEYNIRAVAINSQGTNYSEEIKEKTDKLSAPVVTTQSLSDNDLGANWVKVIGIIENKGASEDIVSRGFVWSTTNKEPTNTDSRLDVDATTDEFSATITDLSPSVTYYLRAFAANKIDGQTKYGYGNVIIFTTQAYKKATFSEVTVGEVSASSANLACTVTPGTGSVKSKGFCYSKSNKTPTIEHGVSVVEGESNDMTATLEGLDENTTYYVRAFVTSTGMDGKEETAYSDVAEFNTKEYVAVTFSGLKVTDVTKHSAKVSAVVDGGTVTIVEKGFCWKKGTEAPTVNDHKQAVDDADFEFTLTGLDDNSNYRVRAYAIYKRGSKQETVYSEVAPIATESYKLPTFSNLVHTDVTKTSATLSASITNGDVTITEKGFCWGTSNNPTTENSKVAVEGDELKTTIKDLTFNKKYYYRAYAIYQVDNGEANTSTTLYSESATFTTENYKYPAADLTVSDIGLNSAKFTATWNEDGSEVTVTEKGFCWASSDKTSAPTLTNNDGAIAVDGDDFSHTLEKLTAGKTYYVCVYIKIKESEEALYYTVKSFTTKTPTAPSFGWSYTPEKVEATTSSFTVKAKLNNAGTPTASKVGFCWSTTEGQKPESMENKKDVTLAEDNTFTLTVSDLKSGDVYYVYAYAINDAGTTYSANPVKISIKRSPTDDDNVSPDKVK